MILCRTDIKLCVGFLLLCVVGACKVRKAVKNEISAKINVILPVFSDTAAMSVSENTIISIDSLPVWQAIYIPCLRARALLPDFRTLSAKIAAEYNDTRGEHYNFTIYLRMLKDSIVWLSFNSFGVFETFRVYITPNQVRILDKLSSVVQIRSVGYLQKLLGIPLDFALLQSVIFGLPIGLNDTVQNIEKCGKDQLYVYTKSPVQIASLEYNLSDSTLSDNRLSIMKDNLPLTIALHYGKYDKWVSDMPVLFSYGRKITVQDKKSMELILNFKGIQRNIMLTFPFSVPPKYTVIKD